MKRTLSLILAALMLASTMASCGKTEPSETSPAETKAPATESVETKAPAGYNLLPSPIGFAVDVNGSASLLDDAAGWAATADADGLSHLTVYNKSGFVLPETGGTGTLPYTAGGLLIIATASLLLYIQFKRRREGTTA